MDPATLHQRFPLPGLTFDAHNGLTRLHIDTPTATATLYLQGAHLTAWQPAGFDPALLLSSKSVFAPGKPIRGGIPIVFPWFSGDRKKDRIHDAAGTHPGPSHGFARIQEWELVAATSPEGVMHLTLTLGPTDLSRSMGYDAFSVELKMAIGRVLSLSMTVKNTGPQPLFYEQAFHAYYRVADIHETVVGGLESVPFLDKADAGKLKPAEQAAISFTRTVDRIYNGTATPCTITDTAGRRRTLVAKQGSNSTVVWNAFAEGPELGPWDWHEYVAVETANVGEDAITLAPGASATMQLHVSPSRL